MSDGLEEHGLDRPIDMEAMRLTDAAIEIMGEPIMCPFCSMLWDAKEAKRLMEAGDMRAYAEWLMETEALPANAEGDSYGTRPVSE